MKPTTPGARVEAVLRGYQPDSRGQTRKLVLLGIAVHDGDGGSWPSIGTLAEYASVDERNVRRALRALESEGLVSTYENEGGTRNTRADRRANLFVVDYDRLVHDMAVSPPRGSNGGAPAPERGGAGARHGGAAAPAEQDIEQEEEQDSADEVDATRAFTEFWDSWTPTTGRNKGPKRTAQERFTKLGPKLRERMLATTRGYLAMCESQQRATVDCATWLGSSDKSWRAWEDEFTAETVTIRDDYATLPPWDWTAEERALVARQAAERPPDMWEPAVLRLLIHERPDGTEVRNTLGTVPFPPASDTPGVTADDGTLMAWWAERRSAAA